MVPATAVMVTPIASRAHVDRGAGISASMGSLSGLALLLMVVDMMAFLASCASLFFVILY
jgi:hypothetical protein